MRALIITLLSSFLMTPSFGARLADVDIDVMARDSRPAANASLVKFGKLVTEKNAVKMGFTSPGDTKLSRLDTPLSGFMVRLDSLRAFQKGDDPIKLLKSTGQIIYPVRVGNTVRSSVTLKRQGNKWRAVSYGSPILAKSLNGARATVVKRDKRQAAEFIQVTIPAFNLSFVGNVVGGKLMLTPISDVSMYGLKATVTQPAEKIFLSLKPEAARHDGLPR
jgi:hypothetical protein